ncbi:hypothetical protein AU476_13865 [Cupriavidus sp. UYMSc13B]|nr:hypothetical protein AU476_13865 [Cupriavidus sp. UYMSc13B]
MSERGQPLGVGLTIDDSLGHGAAAAAEHIREDAAQLEVGVFEHFLDTQAVLGNLAHELLAGVVPKSLNGGF